MGREAARRLFEARWRFVRGAPGLAELPPADRPEIAFAGRSNVGKSSLLNALVRQHGLARISNTPGRTRELNFFAPDGLDLYLVDMPGYGYARAPRAAAESWGRLVVEYLRGRPSLRRVYLLIDARRGLKPIDREIMALLDGAAVSWQLVLTKADKLADAALAAVASAARDEVGRRGAAFPEVIVTSATKGRGIEELREAIAAVVSENGPR